MATTHPYLPLDVSRNEIRLAILKPSCSIKVKVSCTLVHCSLDSEAPFEALSYTWGDASSKRLVLLNGRKFLLTENLDTTLYHLKYIQNKKIIWINTLCINQDDILERNQQVTKMQNMYRKAIKVIVWLGSDPVIPILRSNSWLRRLRRSLKSRIGCLELLENQIASITGNLSTILLIATTGSVSGLFKKFSLRALWSYDADSAVCDS
jgi:hypothetical protein